MDVTSGTGEDFSLPKLFFRCFVQSVGRQEILHKLAEILHKLLTSIFSWYLALALLVQLKEASIIFNPPVYEVYSNYVVLFVVKSSTYGRVYVCSTRKNSNEFVDESYSSKPPSKLNQRLSTFARHVHFTSFENTQQQ